MKPMVRVVVDGEQVDREMTDNELKEHERYIAERIAKAKADATAEATELSARREAIRKLKTVVGLTDDEIKAIRRA